MGPLVVKNYKYQWLKLVYCVLNIIKYVFMVGWKIKKLWNNIYEHLVYFFNCILYILIFVECVIWIIKQWMSCYVFYHFIFPKREKLSSYNKLVGRLSQINNQLHCDYSTLKMNKSGLKTPNLLQICLFWDQWCVIDSGDSSDTCSSYNQIIVWQ